MKPFCDCKSSEDCPYSANNGWSFSLCSGTAAVPEEHRTAYRNLMIRGASNDDGSARAEEEASEVRYWSTRRCAHRGEESGSVMCKSCGGSRSMPAYACKIHGLCVQLKRPLDESIQWCGTCKDYEKESLNAS